MITKEFLESKLNGENECQDGNIRRVSKEVFKFTVYNLLGGGLTGHFTFYVNAETFQYVFYKSADYYNLISVLPVEFNGFQIPGTEKSRVEAIIAKKLLGAYFYSGNSVNGIGRSLFSSGEWEEAGPGWKSGMIRWTDGPKISCIFNAKPNEIDLKAIEIL